MHLVACIIERTHNLVPREECHGISLHDGTAFGPSHCRILFSSLEKYMGGHELARCIFDRGAPKIFDYQNVSRTTTNTKRELLIDALDWWMRFLRDYIMEEHLRPLENHDIFRETENIRSRPHEIRSAPYKITTAIPHSWNDNWRRGQRGQWLWLEDGHSNTG